MNRRFPAIAAASLAVTHSTVASITTFLDDKPGWTAMTGSTTEVDFVPTIGTVQLVPGSFYSNFGIALSAAWTDQPLDWALFPSDTATDGFVGHPAGFPTYTEGAINFAQPVHAFAMDRFAGVGALVSFYSGGSLIVQSSIPSSSIGNHSFGWVTDFNFDRVLLGSGVTDNIYFSTIPAPASALSLVGLMLLRGRRRT